MAYYYIEKIIRAALSHEGNNDEKLLWLQHIFGNLGRYHFLEREREIIQTTIELMPEDFLNLLFSDDEDQQNKIHSVLEFQFEHDNLFRTVDIDRLIRWCLENSTPIILKTIARALPIFSSDGEDGPPEINDDAIKFLEAALYPEEVLKGYSTQIIPDTWSGNLSFIMENNVKAFSYFAEHTDSKIASAARDICEGMRIGIERERENEKKRDETQEQRFE